MKAALKIDISQKVFWIYACSISLLLLGAWYFYPVHKELPLYRPDQLLDYFEIDEIQKITLIDEKIIELQLNDKGIKKLEDLPERDGAHLRFTTPSKITFRSTVKQLKADIEARQKAENALPRSFWDPPVIEHESRLDFRNMIKPLIPIGVVIFFWLIIARFFKFRDQ